MNEFLLFLLMVAGTVHLLVDGSIFGFVRLFLIQKDWWGKAYMTCHQCSGFPVGVFWTYALGVVFAPSFPLVANLAIGGILGTLIGKFSNAFRSFLCSEC